MGSSDTAMVEAPPRPQRRRRTGRRRLLAVVGVSAVAAVAAGVLGGSGSDGPSASAEDPGLVHVHGLGVNPADNVLYAATHTGLFRLGRDREVARIADRYQDTMGFTVAGPDRFLASGHPDLRDVDLRAAGKPPLLGLVESVDAGRTWRPRSLLGDADLHTIVATGDLLVAYDSTGERVLASSDSGDSWETRSRSALTDLAVDPADPDRMVAIFMDGSFRGSSDGGRSWAAEPVAPAGVTVLRWGAAGLWAGASDGAVHRADDTGEWELVHRFDGAVEALFVNDTHVYAAVEGSGIHRSGDAGRRWTRFYASPG